MGINKIIKSTSIGRLATIPFLLLVLSSCGGGGGGDEGSSNTNNSGSPAAVTVPESTITVISGKA